MLNSNLICEEIASLPSDEGLRQMLRDRRAGYRSPRNDIGDPGTSMKCQGFLFLEGTRACREQLDVQMRFECFPLVKKAFEARFE